MSRPVLNGGARRRALEIAAAASVILLPSLAHAHFTLQAPPNWTAEDGQGSPQKDWPCGNEPNASGMAPMSTGPTTAFKPGDKVTVSIVETVMHPGHYRVALAQSGDMIDLPQDMAASASGSMCQNDDMQSTATFPILADGMLEHTTKLNGVQSFDVTLPTNVTCDKCVLQVREYMAQHGNQPETASGMKAGMNGCYYHHCAYISITPDGTGAGGMSGGAGASTGGAPSMGGAPAQGGTAGTGMNTGMGGAMGQAGTLSASAGSPGSSGTTSSGGRSGTAGAPGSGGTTSTGGSSTMMTGTGGAPSGGHPSGTGGGSGTGIGLTTGAPAGTSGDNSEPTSSDKGGCSVSRPSRGGSLPLGAAGLFALGLVAARRRRR